MYEASSADRLADLGPPRTWRSPCRSWTPRSTTPTGTAAISWEACEWPPAQTARGSHILLRCLAELAGGPCAEERRGTQRRAEPKDPPPPLPARVPMAAPRLKAHAYGSFGTPRAGKPAACRSRSIGRSVLRRSCAPGSWANLARHESYEWAPRYLGAWVRQRGQGMVSSDELMVVATLAGQTIVTAAVTDAWETFRGKIARLLGRGDADRTKLAEQRLDQTHAQLNAHGADSDRTRALAERWTGRLADLLEENPEMEADLRALIQEIQAQLPSAAASASGHGLAVGGNMTITSSRGAFAAGEYFRAKRKGHR